ncbi:MAG: DUF4156 domain-containing protein [Thiotrichales bacterium]|nr:MAG: DUF4156 domain-containing protein [Thiotrichales bacterium]
MNVLRIALPAVILFQSACTWVEPTKEGSEVSLVKAFNVKGCKRIGTANTSVKHEVGIFTRSEEKVTEELVTLAKNKAAEMGGDSIVAQGSPSEGSMNFDVFRCHE